MKQAAGWPETRAPTRLKWKTPAAFQATGVIVDISEIGRAGNNSDGFIRADRDALPAVFGHDGELNRHDSAHPRESGDPGPRKERSGSRVRGNERNVR